jgi:hypothetical protein
VVGLVACRPQMSLTIRTASSVAEFAVKCCFRRASDAPDIRQATHCAAAEATLLSAVSAGPMGSLTIVD